MSGWKRFSGLEKYFRTPNSFVALRTVFSFGFDNNFAIFKERSVDSIKIAKRDLIELVGFETFSSI